jgi:hypothetical protein
MPYVYCAACGLSLRVPVVIERCPRCVARGRKFASLVVSDEPVMRPASETEPLRSRLGPTSPPGVPPARPAPS